MILSSNIEYLSQFNAQRVIPLGPESTQGLCPLQTTLGTDPSLGGLVSPSLLYRTYLTYLTDVIYV